MNLRVSEEEAAELITAAERAGLTVTGYAAAAALAAAVGQPAPRAAVSRRQLAAREHLVEAMAARTELRKLATNVNQAARVANTTGTVPPWLAALAARTSAAVTSVETSIAAIAGRAEP